MTVNAPIELIDEKCLNCPELEIDIVKSVLYGGSEEACAINDLKCAHLTKCKAILNLRSRKEQGSK